jgi:hypothetical protein
MSLQPEASYTRFAGCSESRYTDEGVVNGSDSREFPYREAAAVSVFNYGMLTTTCLQEP